MKNNVSCTFALSGCDLNPEEVKNALLLRPLSIWRQRHEGIIKTYPDWPTISIKYEQNEDSCHSIDDVLDKALAHISQDKDRITALANQYSLEVTINIVVRLNEDDPPLYEISANTCKLISELNATFNLLIYP